jgi:hypothetical protein
MSTTTTSTETSAADPAADHVGEHIEAQFTTHNMTATVMEVRYSDAEVCRDSAKWGVVCEDCGRAQDFHIVLKDGMVDVSEVYVESVEERPCEPYELPEDVETGDHTLEICDETPGVGRERDVECVDCGRTTVATAKPEYAGNYIDLLGGIDCAERFSARELAGAVLYTSIPANPSKVEAGIDQWQYSSGNGWKAEVSGFWTHPEVPVIVVIKSRRGRRWVEIQRSSRPSRRANRIGKVSYETRVSDSKNYEAVVDVLTFMQQTNDMDEQQYKNLTSTLETGVFPHLVKHHEVEADSPRADDKNDGNLGILPRLAQAADSVF